MSRPLSQRPERTTRETLIERYSNLSCRKVTLLISEGEAPPFQKRLDDAVISKGAGLTEKNALKGAAALIDPVPVGREWRFS